MMFASASVHAFFNSGSHFVAYEADSRIFNAILAILRALSA